MSQAKLAQARELIKGKQFDEAREILLTVDHPTADKWLAKIDEIHPPIKKKNAIQKSKNTAISQQDEMKLQMQQARRLITMKDYAGARDILEDIDHPTAHRWLEKLEDIDMFAQPRATQSTTTVVNVNNANTNPGCLVQAIWFWFIGWWLTGIWISLAWFFMLTIIGIPLAILMINRVSQVVALRTPRNNNTSVTTVVNDGVGNTAVVVTDNRPTQINFLIRALYFVLIGWWLSGFWMSLAYFFTLTILGIPLGIIMFDMTPTVLTLRRN